jgi:hypothetical protein
VIGDLDASYASWWQVILSPIMSTLFVLARYPVNERSLPLVSKRLSKKERDWFILHDRADALSLDLGAHHCHCLRYTVERQRSANAQVWQAWLGHHALGINLRDTERFAGQGEQWPVAQRHYVGLVQITEPLRGIAGDGNRAAPLWLGGSMSTPTAALATGRSLPTQKRRSYSFGAGGGMSEKSASARDTPSRPSKADIISVRCKKSENKIPGESDLRGRKKPHLTPCQSRVTLR